MKIFLTRLDFFCRPSSDQFHFQPLLPIYTSKVCWRSRELNLLIRYYKFSTLYSKIAKMAFFGLPGSIPMGSRVMSKNYPSPKSRKNQVLSWIIAGSTPDRLIPAWFFVCKIYPSRKMKQNRC